MCLTIELWKKVLQKPTCVIVSADGARVAYALAQHAIKSKTRSRALFHCA